MPWVTVVGIGEDGLAGLSERGRRAVAEAEVLVGGARHLAMVPEDGRERLIWPRPFDPLLETLQARRGQPVAVLASGDPCCFGVGPLIAGKLGMEAVRIIPAPSAFSLACSRIGWSLPEVDTLTVHGRPIESVHRHVQPGARWLVLSEDGGTPAALADLLAERGYGRSLLRVLEHLGGPGERVREARADEWGNRRAADLNIVAVTCVPGADAGLLGTVPGLPDGAFVHDGQLTKREVRADTLANLVPVVGQCLWDVGAGCGSVAIEWMRAVPRAQAIAVECDAGRARLIEHNAGALGVPRLRIVKGRAPQALRDLATPHAVFIGGGLGEDAGLLERCWAALHPGGRLVVNVVSQEGEVALYRWQAEHGGVLTRIGITRPRPIGRYRGWQPAMPVTQFAAMKREAR